jgi:hypothetical protein
MKEIDWIIREQSLLLKDKGYNETSLNNLDTEGSYKAHLKDKIQDLLDQDLTPIGEETIVLRLFGFFGNDKVVFAFTYGFDMSEQRLDLKQVEATLGKVSLPVAITEGRQLWKSTELYQRVKQLHEGVNIHLESDWKKRMEKVIEEQSRLLVHKGYSNNKALIEQFNKQLRKITNEHSPKFSFQLSMNRKSEEFDYPLLARFSYTIFPDKPLLQLRSAYFKMDKASHLIHWPKAKDIPIPQVIQGRLKEKSLQTIASKISDTQNQPQTVQGKKIK